MTQTDITRPSLLAELPSAPWFASVLAEKQRLDLLTVQEMHDRSLTVEYPDAIERILASVPRDRIKWLSRPVGVFRFEFPSGMTDEEVQAAIFRAAALGREKTVIGTTAQFEIQKRFWILAAACARQSAACCRYVADLVEAAGASPFGKRFRRVSGGAHGLFVSDDASTAAEQGSRVSHPSPAGMEKSHSGNE